MTPPRHRLVYLCVLLLGSDTLRADDMPAVPAGWTTDATPPCAGPSGMAKWIHGEEICRSNGCSYSPWFVPVELFVRVGPAFIVGDSVFADVLDTGIAIEGGAKAFCYLGDEGAWTGELGISHVYNNANDPTPLFVRNELHPLRELNRTMVHAAGGREWYFEDPDHAGRRYFTGVSIGGRVGAGEARFLNGPRVSDIPKGIFVGLDAGSLFPFCGYDLVINARTEWSHDWLDFAEIEDEIDQIKVLLSVGIRY